MVPCGLNCASGPSCSTRFILSGLNVGMIIFHSSIRTAVTRLTRISIWRLRANTNTSIIFFVSDVDEFFVYKCALQVFRISCSKYEIRISNKISSIVFWKASLAPPRSKEVLLDLKKPLGVMKEVTFPDSSAKGS